MKKKLISVIPYLLVNIGLVLLSRFLITDTGLAIFMLLYFLPLVVFVSGLIYGKRNGFCIIFPILILGILFPIFWTIYNPSALFYAFLYGGLALIGNTIGFAFHKKSKTSDLAKVLLAFGEGILFIIFLIFAVKPSFIFHKEKTPTISENSVQFNIINLSNNNLTDISISAGQDVCKGVPLAGKLDQGENIVLNLDFSDDKEKNCVGPKSDGNFTLTYYKNGTRNAYGFGYFTNGILLENYYVISLHKNGEIKVIEGK